MWTKPPFGLRAFRSSRRTLAPYLAMAAVLVATALQLRLQQRPWWCECGRAYLWSGDTNGPHNSQHLLDPYSFTHVLHGMAICGLAAWCLPKLSKPWRLWLAVAVEALWEVIENSQVVIERYRAATIALGYYGDSIANSLGDIMCGGIGCALAWRLGLWRSIVLFVAIEVGLLLWIRDSLLLNILMLIYPFEAIKAWQSG